MDDLKERIQYTYAVRAVAQWRICIYIGIYYVYANNKHILFFNMTLEIDFTDKEQMADRTPLPLFPPNDR